MLGGLGVLAGGSALVLAVGHVAGVLFGQGRRRWRSTTPRRCCWRCRSTWTTRGRRTRRRARACCRRRPASTRRRAAARCWCCSSPAAAARAGAARSLGGAGPGGRARRVAGGRCAPRSGRSRRRSRRRRDTADLVVRGAAAGAGRPRLRPTAGSIATEREHSVLVVGATRSGKTTGYAIPALLEWDGPAVVLSAKTDLLHATVDAPARARRGAAVRPDQGLRPARRRLVAAGRAPATGAAPCGPPTP